MNCGNCGSDNLTRLSLLWERGTAVTTSTDFGMPASGLSASMVMRNVSQTHAAVSASPPKKKHFIVWLIVWFVYAPLPSSTGIACFFFSRDTLPFGFVGIGWFVLVTWFTWKQIVRVNQWNATEFQRQFANWQAQFQCNRCGAIGVPS